MDSGVCGKLERAVINFGIPFKSSMSFQSLGLPMKMVVNLFMDFPETFFFFLSAGSDTVLEDHCYGLSTNVSHVKR